MDFESEDDLLNAIRNDPSIDFNKHLRYSNLNVVFGLMANCNKNAAPRKAMLGKHAYTLQVIIEMMKGRVEKFDLDVDNGRFKIEDLDATFMMVFNGKLGGD
jgi:hypothetical protein